MIDTNNVTFFRVRALGVVFSLMLVLGILSPLEGATTYSVTVTKAGVGTGAVAPSSGTLTWNGNVGTASYAAGTVVVLAATAGAGSTFTSWSGCDSASGSNCGITMTANKNVAVSYSSQSYTYDYTMASSKISALYTQYSSYFGTKSGGVLTGTDGTYFAQWFTNGLGICAWSDGNMYYYNGAAWYSFGVAWKTVIPVPTNFKMGKTSDGFILNWGSVSGATVYYIYWGNDDSVSSGDLNYAGVVQTNTTVYTQTGAVFGDMYYYRIKACDGTGNCSSLSDYMMMEFGL
ncbi:InlB B-repeat-containing protein [Candidatus Magnetominusculus dajiuhuensis]|uniref:InlB B-repeat-containing protein n=1 Tax=Candidatus Magnetominusculus dajiuhuensis TaxID=3137712 RepID=UPI003B42E98A